MSPLTQGLNYRSACDNNNNTLIYIAPACRMTSEALKLTVNRVPIGVLRPYYTV